MICALFPPNDAIFLLTQRKAKRSVEVRSRNQIGPTMQNAYGPKVLYFQPLLRKLADHQGIQMLLCNRGVRRNEKPLIVSILTGDPVKIMPM
jgi:hypothetical protein